jgi:glycosyltransferase involved in cell wall biosynthesis
VARVLIISLSDVGRDPRVARQVEALREEHEVTVAAYGPHERDGIGFFELSTDAHDFSLNGLYQGAARIFLRQAGRFDYAYWRDPRFCTWHDEIASVPADLLVVNDTILLPAALRAANGSPVVFDAHEYAPTQHEEFLRARLFVTPLIRHISRTYLPKVQGMMVVSESIGELYGAYTAVKPVVITNAPPFAAIAPRPVDDKIRLIHFGGADPGRRLEKMIEMMSYLDERFSLELLLVGGDSYVRKLKQLAGSDNRIEFQAPVPMQKLVEVASRADVGLLLYSDDNPQFRYSLPNKFFEYIQARLAVAIGPSPEMARIVRRYGCGLVSDTFEAPDLASLLMAMDESQLWRFKKNADAAAHALTAEENAPLIREIVARALRPNGHLGKSDLTEPAI